MLTLMNQVLVVRNVKKKNKHIFFNFGSTVANYLNSFILSYVRFKTG